jgi:hypothetical protein
VVGNTEYEKKQYFLIDFCAVAEFFEEEYNYSAPLQLPREPKRKPVSETTPTEAASTNGNAEGDGQSPPTSEPPTKRREIPVWLGVDRIISQEVRVVGPNGEKVDVMTFRGSFERDLKDFVEMNDDLREAVEVEDDDAIETILQERFYHRPEMFYAPDKLILSYGVPAPTPAFVYSVMGKKPLPTKERVIEDTVDSISARFNLRYGDQKWLNATAELITDDSGALGDFIEGKYNRLFARSQFRNLGGLAALAEFNDRDEVFEALRESSLVQCSRYALQEAS